jgi:hypothetical protein
VPRQPESEWKRTQRREGGALTHAERIRDFAMAAIVLMTFAIAFMHLLAE